MNPFIDYLRRRNIFDIFSAALYRYMLGTIAWNIGRMPKMYLNEYVKKERCLFGEIFSDRANVLMYSKASLGNKLVWNAIKYKSKFLLGVYRFLARINRK